MDDWAFARTQTSSRSTAATLNKGSRFKSLDMHLVFYKGELQFWGLALDKTVQRHSDSKLPNKFWRGWDFYREATTFANCSTELVSSRFCPGAHGGTNCGRLMFGSAKFDEPCGYRLRQAEACG